MAVQPCLLRFLDACSRGNGSINVKAICWTEVLRFTELMPPLTVAMWLLVQSKRLFMRTYLGAWGLMRKSYPCSMIDPLGPSCGSALHRYSINELETNGVQYFQNRKLA